MSNHLSEIEIVDYLLKGSRAISTSKKRHLELCEQCQKVIKEQFGMDSFMKKMNPLTLSMKLYPAVSTKISEPVSKNKRDWFFYFTILVLIVIGLVLSFSYQKSMNTGFLEPHERVKEVVDQGMNRLNLDWKGSLHSVSTFFNQFILNSLSKGAPLKLILVTLFAIIFYIIIDSHLLKKKS